MLGANIGTTLTPLFIAVTSKNSSSTSKEKEEESGIHTPEPPTHSQLDSGIEAILEIYK